MATGLTGTLGLVVSTTTVVALEQTPDIGFVIIHPLHLVGVIAVDMILNQRVYKLIFPQLLL